MNSRDPSLALTSKKYQFRRVMSRVNGPEKGHSQHPGSRLSGFHLSRAWLVIHRLPTNTTVAIKISGPHPY